MNQPATTSAAAAATSTPGTTADRRGPSGLTSRQMEAALLAQSGLDVPAIALQMHLSQRSARRHLSAARAAGVRTRPATATADPMPAPAQRRDGKFTTPKPPPARARVYMGDGQGHEIRYADRRSGSPLGKEYSAGDPEIGPDGKPTGRYALTSVTIQAPVQSALAYFSPTETEARQRAIESGAVKAYRIEDGVLTEVEELV
jgi:DNA-binding CsgD family transcriptional regulator